MQTLGLEVEWETVLDLLSVNLRPVWELTDPP